MEHDWIDYDERHKACRACGLRLFWANGTAYGQRGWLLVDYYGVTSPNLLGSGGSKFGECTPPAEAPIVETVLIDGAGKGAQLLLLPEVCGGLAASKRDHPRNQEHPAQEIEAHLRRFSRRLGSSWGGRIIFAGG